MEAGGLLIPRPQAEFQKPMKKGMANELEEAKMRKCFKKDQLLTVLNDIKKQKRSRKKCPPDWETPTSFRDSDEGLFRKVVRNVRSLE